VIGIRLGLDRFNRVGMKIQLIRIRLFNIRIRAYLNLNIRTLSIITLGIIYLYFYLKTIWSLMRRQIMNYIVVFFYLKWINCDLSYLKGAIKSYHLSISFLHVIPDFHTSITNHASIGHRPNHLIFCIFIYFALYLLVHCIIFSFKNKLLSNKTT